MPFKILVNIFILCLLVFSCKKEKEHVDFHHDYFPLQPGTFVEYEVTQIKHDDVSDVHDTIKFQMKTIIGDTVIDNTGRVARKFYRYVYSNSLQKYVVQDLWTAIIDQERAELVEENQRVIKLVFAPTLSKEWDMNAFNSYDPVLVYYEKIHKPFKVDELSFDSTITVEEDSTLNFIQYKRKFEVYAKGIGLIKKHYQDFTINNFDYSFPILGDELFYVIKNFGVE